MIKGLKTFFSFIVRKKLQYAGFIFLVIFAAILFSLNPYFYKLFTENIQGGSFDTLLGILLIYMAARVLSQAIDMLSGVVGDVILFRAATEARTEVFNHVQDLDFAFHSSKSSGSLISAFKRGDGAFYNIFHTIHYNLIGVVISFFTMLYFFASLNLLITSIVVVSFVLIAIFLRFLVVNNVKKRSIFNEEEDNVSGIITDNLINFDTVKFFSKESWERGRLSRAFVPWLKSLWGYVGSFRLIDVTMFTILNITILLILLISIKDATEGRLSVPDFVLVTGFVSIFFPRLWDMVWGFREIAKNYSDIEKYFNILGYKIRVKDPENPVEIKDLKGEIVFEDVSFSYKQRKSRALKNLNLTIKAGESVALVGRSGSGKTTFVRLLMRFYDPIKGSIKIDGVNIKKVTKSNLRGNIGLVPQEPILFNNTIRFNIGYGKPEANLEEIKKAAKLANIDEFIESLPRRYKTQVGERGVKLSGGQKQRLAIARVILANPQIIIFDEATSHLDSESERLIQDAFWKTAKNKTTIVIAHRLSTISKADKIVVMSEGEIVEMGSHKELLGKMDGVYKHLWDLQVDVD